MYGALKFCERHNLTLAASERGVSDSQARDKTAMQQAEVSAFCKGIVKVLKKVLKKSVERMEHCQRLQRCSCDRTHVEPLGAFARIDPLCRLADWTVKTRIIMRRPQQIRFSKDTL